MSGSVIVERPGTLMSVQDRGRPGLLSFGISGSGAMDQGALAIANALVGNADNAAGLEFAIAGGALTVDRDCLVAVTGGARDVRIGEKKAWGWQSYRLRRGERFAVGALGGAVWGYVAISGGIDVPPVLGSRATHLRSAIGGCEGRVLVAGDRLPLGPEPGGAPRVLRVPYRHGRGPVRIVPGPQDDYFDATAWRTFLSNTYLVTAKRDRMAMVLDGPPLAAAKGHDIVSDATVFGSIQVPSSAQPIVLTADRQTTGGYPKIATVASADLARLVQTPSGAAIRLQRISQDAAEELLLSEQANLHAVLESLQSAAERADAEN